MANRYFAVVKKDDYETTASTGGIVVSIKNWPENASDRTAKPYDLELSFGAGHELVPCDENVQIGWIYTDKTHQFVDSNISSN